MIIFGIFWVISGWLIFARCIYGYGGIGRMLEGGLRNVEANRVNYWALGDGGDGSRLSCAAEKLTEIQIRSYSKEKAPIVLRIGYLILGGLLYGLAGPVSIGALLGLPDKTPNKEV